MGNPFAKRVKDRRRELELSLRDICKHVLNEDGKPISVSYLNDIEQGYRNPPSGKIVVQLAEALKLEPQILLNLAGKVHPIVENAVNENVEIGQLFRKIIEKSKHDPNIFKRVSREIEKKND